MSPHRRSRRRCSGPRAGASGTGTTLISQVCLGRAVATGSGVTTRRQCQCPRAGRRNGMRCAHIASRATPTKSFCCNTAERDNTAWYALVALGRQGKFASRVENVVMLYQPEPAWGFSLPLDMRRIYHYFSGIAMHKNGFLSCVSLTAKIIKRMNCFVQIVSL